MFRMLRRIGIFGCPPQLSKVVKNRSQIKTGDIVEFNDGFFKLIKLKPTDDSPVNDVKYELFASNKVDEYLQVIDPLEFVLRLHIDCHDDDKFLCIERANP